MASGAEKHRASPGIVVAGAGSVGCFVGGMLARGVHNVTLLLRPYMSEEISRQGLTLSDFGELDEELSPDMFSLATDPVCLAEADIILVTVKSGATSEIAKQIARHASKSAIIVSLQNGVQNAGILREALPGRDVRAGIVVFNVIGMGGGHFHRGTSGDILIEKGPGHLARTLSVGGLQFHERKRMPQLQWGKLLINLTNGLNALSGLPIKKQIGDMRWRRLMADQMSEALKVLDAAGIETANPVPGPLAMRHVPVVLRLPTAVFRVVARAMLSIDPNARSSMWFDLEKGRDTEIGELQGQIVKMAHEHGIPVPINERVAELVRQYQAVGTGSPKLSLKEVRGL
ncbi:2-dehydropantoate 2-reductase [Shimia sp.]|uniref:2-dehydropantoate 2-reductase n=1 Tax=Shimia sp. TaxID=1954381 RepID=UPI003297A2AA